MPSGNLLDALHGNPDLLNRATDRAKRLAARFRTNHSAVALRWAKLKDINRGFQREVELNWLTRVS